MLVSLPSGSKFVPSATILLQDPNLLSQSFEVTFLLILIKVVLNKLKTE